jgi:hypothetical protein
MRRIAETPQRQHNTSAPSNVDTVAAPGSHAPPDRRRAAATLSSNLRFTAPSSGLTLHRAIATAAIASVNRVEDCLSQTTDVGDLATDEHVGLSAAMP